MSSMLCIALQALQGTVKHIEIALTNYRLRVLKES